MVFILYISLKFVLFLELVKWFEKVEQTTKRLEMIDILSELLGKLEHEEIPPTIYLTTGELGPKYDMIILGLQEKQVMKIISDLTGHSVAKIKERFDKLGDLGDLIYEMPSASEQTDLSSFLGLEQKTESQTILDIWNVLRRVGSIQGTGTEKEKINILTSVMRKLDRLERKYFVRILVGKMRIGAKDSTWLDAAAKFTHNVCAVEELDYAFAIQSDIGLVVQTLVKEGRTGVLALFNPNVGTPIMPMLPHRGASSSEIWDRMGGKCEIEIKYDGYRLQMHKQDKKVNLWSRNEESYDSIFPEIVNEISNVIDASTAILDGEVIAYDYEKDEMLNFQILTNRRRKYGVKQIMETINIKVYIFDLLYLDGKSTMNLPLPKRKALIQKILKPSTMISMAESISCNDPEDIDQQMMIAKDLKREGIMVKSIGDHSFYEPGKRSYLWLKYKADYQSSLADTFDLVIVGGWKGKGKRAGFYGTLLMAAWDPKEEVYRTFCRLGAGLTDEIMQNLTAKMEALKLNQKPSDVLSNLDPDIWVKPEIILEVSAAEISESPVHTVIDEEGRFLSLRFPRFTGNIRTDKNAPNDVTTLEEISTLINKK